MFIEAKLFKKAGEGSGGGTDPHNLGYYATPTALQTAHSTGTDGDFAIVGTTDTIWVWDTDTSAWVDTDTKGQVTSVNGATGAVTIGANDVLPTQTGYSGRVLGTDGFVAGWVKPEIVQCSALPTASEEEVDNIYQYVGTTDANYTNGYFYKCVSDGQTPATYSWTRVDVQPTPSELPNQSGNSGKFLTTDGTDPSWATINALQNTAIGTNSLAILGTAISSESVVIGASASSSRQESVAVGKSSSAEDWATAVGKSSRAGGAYSVANGCSASSSSAYAIAIGGSAVVGSNANYAIQIGRGTNSDAGTLKIGTKYNDANVNYELMSADGTIPAARHASLPATDGTYVLKLVIADGTPTLSWVAE